MVLPLLGLRHLHLQLPAELWMITDVHNNYRAIGRMLNYITFKKEENSIVERFFFQVMKDLGLLFCYGGIACRNSSCVSDVGCQFSFFLLIENSFLICPLIGIIFAFFKSLTSLRSSINKHFIFFFLIQQRLIIRRQNTPSLMCGFCLQGTHSPGREEDAYGDIYSPRALMLRQALSGILRRLSTRVTPVGA